MVNSIIWWSNNIIMLNTFFVRKMCWQLKANPGFCWLNHSFSFCHRSWLLVVQSKCLTIIQIMLNPFVSGKTTNVHGEKSWEKSMLSLVSFTNSSLWHILNTHVCRFPHSMFRSRIPPATRQLRLVSSVTCSAYSASTVLLSIKRSSAANSWRDRDSMER